MNRGIKHSILAALALAGCCGLATAQPVGRRATSPAALVTFPGFFQGQPVVVRGTLSTRDQAVLTSPSIDRAIPLLFNGPSPADGAVELRATFWDLGRLPREDPRVLNLGLARLLPNGGEGDWPRPGEALALVVSDATTIKPTNGPTTLRLIALNPDAYVGQRVTVTGQFRGRNLFGDIPQAPGVSKWDFVLHNGDAALWVTGERPKGKGFNLDVDARVDTRVWLEVTGTVRTAHGLVWLEAAPPFSLAKPDTTFVVEALPPPEMGPRPEVIFSDPDQGDTDVPLKRVIRLQFSRDMNPDSFKGNVHARYAGSQAGTELPQAGVSVHYEKANRSLEVKLSSDQALLQFRNIVLELTDGIAATDGAKLRPWSVRFAFAGE